MAGRRNRGDEELPFSLDSFLDIVANLVGILVRLIVMVGLGVQALPPSSKMVEADREAAAKRKTEYDAEVAKRRADWEAKKTAIERDNAAKKLAHAERVAARELELDRRKQVEEERLRAQSAADRELEDRKRAIAQRLAQLKDFERQASELQGDVGQLASAATNEQSLLDRELAAVQKIDLQVTNERESLAELRRAVESQQVKLDQERLRRQSLDDQLAELREEIAKLEKLPKPVKTLPHLGAAVAKEVTTGELHYRCLRGRIAPTYMQDLIGRLRDRAMAAAEGGRFERTGVVGPIGGFQLRYVIDRGEQGFSERSRFAGRYSVQARLFVLEAESEELGEVESAALAGGSEFWKSLEKADAAGNVITLWVYPDSFRLAKAVEMAVHAKGFSVAMRPMPEGMPVTGSPSGSASQAH